MKKTFVLLITILTMILVMSFPMLALADSGAPEPAQAAETNAPEAETDAITNVLIENAVNIAATLVITLIGVLGVWLTNVFSRGEKLKNITAAQKELIKMAQITVGELKQTVSDKLKAAHTDGKLSKDEIKSLRADLVMKTKQKMSDPALALLEAASVDINNLILGTGDDWIDKLKTQNAAIAVGLEVGTIQTGN